MPLLQARTEACVASTHLSLSKKRFRYGRVSREGSRGVVVLESGCERACIARGHAAGWDRSDRRAAQSAKLRVRCGARCADASHAPFPSAFVSCLRSEGV
ncbi:hypothetical protein C7S15_0764 [Burkholderia cepacia]|nr:hypothetical protein [Burkholderia cepacia]